MGEAFKICNATRKEIAEDALAYWTWRNLWWILIIRLMNWDYNDEIYAEGDGGTIIYFRVDGQGNWYEDEFYNNVKIDTPIEKHQIHSETECECLIKAKENKGNPVPKQKIPNSEWTQTFICNIRKIALDKKYNGIEEWQEISKKYGGNNNDETEANNTKYSQIL